MFIACPVSLADSTHPAADKHNVRQIADRLRFFRSDPTSNEKTPRSKHAAAVMKPLSKIPVWRAG